MPWHVLQCGLHKGALEEQFRRATARPYVREKHLAATSGTVMKKGGAS
ncbi:MAG: hypothetical protein K1V78_04490 [Muribaculaceae bacterium]